MFSSTDFILSALLYMLCIQLRNQSCPGNHAFLVSSNRMLGALYKIENWNQKILDQVWLCTCIKFNNDFWTSVERITAAVKNAGSHSEFLPSEVLISWCQPNGSWPLVMRLSRNTILYQQFLFYLLNNKWIRHWLVLVAQTCLKWYLLLLVQF